MSDYPALIWVGGQGEVLIFCTVVRIVRVSTVHKISGGAVSFAICCQIVHALYHMFCTPEQLVLIQKKAFKAFKTLNSLNAWTLAPLLLSTVI